MNELETSLQKLGSPLDDFSTMERDWLTDYADTYEEYLANLTKLPPFQSGRSKILAKECEQMLLQVNEGQSSVPTPEVVLEASRHASADLRAESEKVSTDVVGEKAINYDAKQEFEVIFGEHSAIVGDLLNFIEILVFAFCFW